MPDDDSSRRNAGRWLLAIDTSSDMAGIALFDGDHVFLRQWPCVREQTTQVLPAIYALLAEASLAFADLRGVAVASGPGSFTGLRVGMSIAKGFALGRSMPIVGVPTLEATACPWTRLGANVIAVLPAGRGRLVWQRFGNDVAGDAPHNTTVPELAAASGGPRLDAIVGDLTPSLRDELNDLPVPIITGPQAPVRVGAIASLGWARVQQGDHDDLDTLEPTYIHGVRKATQAIVDPQA